MTHVLIVEDHEGNRNLLKTLLVANGYRVTAAGDGLEALAAARRDPPDVIVSDVLMPKMDGYVLCHAWMQDAALRTIPFIFYSATHVRPEDEQLGLALGAVRYLVKPLDQKVFLLEMRAVLQQWAGHTAPAPASPLNNLTSHALHESALARKLQDKIAQLEVANRRLRESEAHFRAIAANTPDFFLVQDHDLRYELVINPPLGLTEADMIHKTDGDIIGKEDAEKLTAIKRKVLETGEPVQLETSLQNLKEQTEFFEGSYVPKFDSTGNTDGLIGYFRNVTERKQAEKEIRSLARFSSENPNPILRVRRDGVLLYANKSSRSVLSEWACAVGQPVPPFWRTLAAETLGSNSRKTVDVEFGHRTYAFVVAPIQGGGYANLYGRDITDRKLAMDALQQSERRYHHLFDNMHEGFAHCRVIFEDGRPRDVVYIDVNPAFERLTGLKNVVGRTLTEVIPGIRETNPEVFERYGHIASTGKPETFEIYVPSIGIWFLISAFCPEHGYFVAVFENITERKRAEEALRRSNERLRDLSQRLIEVEAADRRNINRELHDRIGGNLSALNLSLNIIRSALGQASLRAIGARLQEAQRLLEETTAQVRNVMADLHPPALEDYGLQEALRTYVESLGARLGVPITLHGDYPAPRLPSVAEMALFRVAQGALTNAVSHARATRVRVLLAATPDRETLSIADDGVGFDAVHTALAHANWGLTIMRERAQAVGAEFRVESAPDKGTRIVVEIPRGGRRQKSEG